MLQEEKLQKRYYPPEWVNELRSKLDIVQVISSYLQVNKRGNVHWALCPFHHEKTPSFAINEDDQFYHCFGCGEGGDVIKFVQQIESISYPEALEKLAERAGMKLPEVEDGEKIEKAKQEKDEILKALDLAMKEYEKNLYEPFAKPAQEYVKLRNFKKSDLTKFHIGYANGNMIIPSLVKQGVKVETLVKAGIAGKDEESGKYYDKLSRRLIFPVLNSYEQCIAYSGRILEKSDFKAKYKNTEQTPVFDKGSSVYAIDLLKQAKRNGTLKYIILVEGQIDVIMMHSNGFNTAVASLGTAFTEKHAAQLKRFSTDIVVCYDGDGAGQKATMRAIGILEKEGFAVKVARLPKGKDPDEFLKEFGKDAMQKLLDNAKTPIEYKLDLLKEKFDVSKPEGKASYLKEAFEILQAVETLSEKDVYLKIISQVSNVPIDILRRDAQSGKKMVETSEEKNVLRTIEDGNIKAVKFALKAIINRETYSKLDFDLEKYLINPIYISILKKVKETNSKEEFFEKLDENEKDIVEKILELQSFGEGKEYFNQCVWKIVENNLKTKQQMLNEQYKAATSYDERKEIAEKLNEIIKKLSERKL